MPRPRVTPSRDDNRRTDTNGHRPIYRGYMLVRRGEHADGPTVRPPAVAGLFYPADPDVLADMVDSLLDGAAQSLRTGEGVPVPTRGAAQVEPDAIRAVIVPHAGYVYSGSTAALAWDLLRRGPRPERVTILGPTHRVGILGVALPGAEAFATPLGVNPIDDSGLDELVIRHPATHRDEHSLEVQVPFVQRLWGDVPVTPLAVGDATADHVCAVVEALTGPTTLVVISSDLSHYHPHEVARQLDDETIGRILACDPTIPTNRACGAHPVNGALTAARDLGWQPHLLGACTSADTAGDPYRVVGYSSFALTGEAS